MSNEVQRNTDAANWIDQLNLPKLIAGPAGEALSRLIGGGVDIPVALLERIASEIRTKTAARNSITTAIGNEVAESSRKDAELVERANNSFLIKELRKQANKEAVARKSIEHLRDEPSAADSPARPDDDWLNVFEQYAEQASSEKLQETWSRVLAGEIRKPRTFSLRTLRFISELDQETAALFEKHAPFIISGSFMIKSDNPDYDVSELIQLESAGLISDVGGNLTKTYTFTEKGVLLKLANDALLLFGPVGSKLHMNCIVVTKIGQEISRILKPQIDKFVFDEIVKSIPKNNVERIDVGPYFSTRGDQVVFHKLSTVWQKQS